VVPDGRAGLRDLARLPRDIVLLSQSSKGLLRLIYKVMTLGSSNISERSLAIDERVGWIVTLIGIPSAFLLHGYVGFIFGSIKANPWWSSPLMPVVFIFSAMVSGIAGVMLLYMAITKLRKQKIDMRCVDTIAMYLFYIFIIDFSLEMLDLIHRIYEADESFRSLNFMVHTQLYFSHIVIQICLGTLTPLVCCFLTQVVKLPRSCASASTSVSDAWRLIGIFAMRWNVVIGGQLFSKSFLGYTTYKMSLVTREGLLVAIALTLLPLVFLWVLVKLLPPWPEKSAQVWRLPPSPSSTRFCGWWLRRASRRKSGFPAPSTPALRP
jgi:Ni/Fe-hydrogenase subunit HybB-like protein